RGGQGTDRRCRRRHHRSPAGPGLLPGTAGQLQGPKGDRTAIIVATNGIREDSTSSSMGKEIAVMSASKPLSWEVLNIDLEAEADRIAGKLREATARILKRRGLVVAVSGGIDSSCSLALAVRALGAARVHALILPERDSSSDSAVRGRLLADHLG